MNTSLLIASAALAAVTLMTIIVRRQREFRAGLNIAARHGWKVSQQPARYWRHHLRNVAVFRMGHSRRIGHVLETGDGVSLVPLVFDTGFGARRSTHSLRLAVCDSSRSVTRATLTRQDWLVAAVAGPTAVQLVPFDENGSGAARFTAVIHDEDAWRTRLAGRLSQWLRNQPPERSWEILPGMIVGHEPGGFSEGGLTMLADAASELRGLLNGDSTYDDGAAAEVVPDESAVTGCEAGAGGSRAGREVAS